ncbi:MAG: Uma2 family endonuclease [Gemmataceae bacterium]|nr:Uma2 family endonuclease [Planctomycetia bacterium]MBX3400547.1 Uma2 family endonuclease [Gemmataceae bacterium]
MTTETSVEIDYPGSDGKPMAETQLHIRSIISLYEQMLRFYSARDDVLVTVDLFWYWKEGNNRRRIAPDIMVIPGVSKEPPRRTYLSWKEGVVPAMVVEFASQGTWRKDLGKKFNRYEKLGVKEYFIFDPEGLYLVPTLQGHRLRGRTYRRVFSDDGSLPTELGFRLVPEGTILRMIDVKTGNRILTGSEQAEEETRRAEHEKQRADHLQAEVANLKALLQKYVPPTGNGS